MRNVLPLAAAFLLACCAGPIAFAQPIPPTAPKPDPYAERNRVFVLTDIGNEPDDQMSFVRLLLYSNELELEGLAATTSQHLKTTTNPQTLRKLITAYGQVRPNLLKHAQGWPTAAALDGLVISGPNAFGLAAIDPKAPSAAAQALIRATDRTDTRPLWVSIWGGANVLAEALQLVRKTRSADQLDLFIGKLRIYSISDQDDSGPWIRREFPNLQYIIWPGGDYGGATWTGISGESFYLNDVGSADSTKVSDKWLDTHIRKGPLGKLYPHVEYIMEGDTPAFLGLLANGLNGAMSPSWGGWGGRYFYRQPYGETRPMWTQGGFPAFGINSRDEVVGIDGRKVRSDQATVWRWRDAFQNDFAARIDWTIKPFAEANHRPVAVINGDGTLAPILIQSRPGQPIQLDASASSDPDRGQTQRYRWWVYQEAGASLTRPADVTLSGADGPRATATIAEGCRPPIPRMKIPCGARTAHVILEVRDNGAPELTSYRRIVISVPSASK